MNQSDKIYFFYKDHAVVKTWDGNGQVYVHINKVTKTGTKSLTFSAEAFPSFCQNVTKIMQSLDRLERENEEEMSMIQYSDLFETQQLQPKSQPKQLQPQLVEPQLEPQQLQPKYQQQPQQQHQQLQTQPKPQQLQPQPQPQQLQTQRSVQMKRRFLPYVERTHTRCVQTNSQAQHPKMIRKATKEENEEQSDIRLVTNTHRVTNTQSVNPLVSNFVSQIRRESDKQTYERITPEEEEEVFIYV
ncbi:putative uncharacterized protein DDB_G0294196 [Gigantopelta aegis]|uniref:putative uncharacterized protein DDB_G0294196 n=1 Tax=Gigantopelta aegis TaxID=1735272 RepID=UPI001B88C0DB|nr:putative uncharacterized protein DDB_G0294196 [Gigantopelta aegis]